MANDNTYIQTDKAANKTQKDRIVRFFMLKLWMRLLTLLIGASILYINILSIKDGEYSSIALSLGLLFFIAGLLENSWHFNISKEQAVQKRGLFFFSKKRIIKFSEIHSIEIETFKRPGRFGSFSEVKMVLLDGKTFIIDNDKTKMLQRQLDEIVEVQDIIKRKNNKKAEDFFNAVAADILGTKEEIDKK